MRYLVSVIADTDGIALASPREDAAIDVFNERLQAEGHWVFAGGLGGATVIDNRGDEAMFTDGAFVEAGPYLAGLWVMEAAAVDVARRDAAEGSRPCNRKVRVRPIL